MIICCQQCRDGCRGRATFNHEGTAQDQSYVLSQLINILLWSCWVFWQECDVINLCLHSLPFTDLNGTFTQSETKLLLRKTPNWSIPANQGRRLIILACIIGREEQKRNMGVRIGHSLCRITCTCCCLVPCLC